MRQIIQILPLIILSVLSVFLASGKVRFGHGFGDILYHGLSYLGLFVYGAYFLWTRKNKLKERNFIFPILANLFCGYLILSMTIWRGHEYRWNGDILVPSMETRNERKHKRLEDDLVKSKRQIENKFKEDKEKLRAHLKMSHIEKAK